MSYEEDDSDMSDEDTRADTGAAEPLAAKVFLTVNEAVKQVEAVTEPVARAIDQYRADVETFIESQLENRPELDNKGAPAGINPTKMPARLGQTAEIKSEIADAWAELQVNLKTAENGFSQSARTAGAAMTQTIEAWDLARTSFHMTMRKAKATLDNDVGAALDSFEKANNKDSRSRGFYVYSTLENNVALATVTFEASAGGAYAGLATAASAVIGEYATFSAAIGNATAQLRQEDRSYWMAFWQKVEGSLDKT